MTSSRGDRLLIVSGLAFLALGTAARAEVTGITFSRSSPFGATTFGSAGAYEQLDGVVTGEIDPHHPLNRIVQDIERAPRNVRGNVEYAMTFSILKPADLARSNHTLVYDVVNRGNKLITSFLNVGTTTANPAGDGFLQKQGFILVWSGWQGDALAGGGREVMTLAPVAHHKDGSSITGEVRQEYTPAAAVPSEPLAGNALTAPIETATLDNSTATLTRRIHHNDPKELIPRSQWAFADCSATNPFPGTPSTTRVCLQGGFDTNHIYELVYTGKDPKVMGIGFAATRDLVSFLRGHGRRSGPANPLAGAVRSTIGFGISQSGRFLRTFTELGFNEDENGNRVFDGLDPDIASYRIHTCPKVFNTVSSTEYWQAGMSFTTVDADADEDLEIPENVRIYLFASAQHGGSQPAVAATQNPVCEQLSNLNSYTYNFRALLVALRDWVAHGQKPPHSRYATLRRRTLVPAHRVAFPSIPGVTFVGNFNSRQVLDRGRGFDARDESGVMDEPPAVRFTYRELLPQVDADGNEVDAVRSTQVRVPLGTYSGWNTRKVNFGNPDLCDLSGQYIPFAVHQADRKGDPRRSVEERYASKAGYMARVREAVEDQVEEGLLLPDDAATIIAQEMARDIGLP